MLQLMSIFWKLLARFTHDEADSKPWVKGSRDDQKTRVRPLCLNQKLRRDYRPCFLLGSLPAREQT